VSVVTFKGFKCAAKQFTEKAKEDVEHLKTNFYSVCYLRFPTLIPYVALSDDGKTLIMEYAVKGSFGTNKELLDLPRERKLRISRGVAEALHFLHTQKPPYIHGRVIPDNILVVFS